MAKPSRRFLLILRTEEKKNEVGPFSSPVGVNNFPTNVGK